MKMFVEIISVLLYFEFVFAVQMNYVYNDNPNLGYIAAITGIGSYSKTKLNGPRKYYVGNTNQKYMKLDNEEAINSLFTVMKNPPKIFAPVPDKINVNSQRNMDDAKQWQVNKLNNRVVNNANVQENYDVLKSDNSKDLYRPSQLSNDIAKPEAVASQERKHYDYYGTQDKYNKINIKAVPKIQLDQLQASKPISQHSANQGAINETNIGGKEKSMHKVNNEHSTMSKLFSDMTQKAFERYQRKQEFRKREIINKKSNKVKEDSARPNGNAKSDVKFHKEHNVKFLDNSRHAPARIRKNGENDKPYALFYRSHENFDQRDFYTGAVDQSNLDNSNNNVDIDINVKDRTDFKNDNRKAKKITNVKLNKKLNAYDNDVIP